MLEADGNSNHSHMPVSAPAAPSPSHTMSLSFRALRARRLKAKDAVVEDLPDDIAITTLHTLAMEAMVSKEAASSSSELPGAAEEAPAPA